jgi:aquaporin Z
MRKYINEFIGTFFLVFVIGMVVTSETDRSFAPIAIGSVLMVMIFAGGHISGAHYNPAVTLAVLIRGKIQLADAIFYIVFQILAAFVAGLLVVYFIGEMPQKAVVMTDVAKPMIAEFVATFALAYVVLNVATAKGNTGNSFYGLAIGFTVMAMAYAVGKISGAFNPAVAVGICYLNLRSWSDIWIFAIGSFGGAAFAAVVFNYLNREDEPVPPIRKD